MSNMESQKNVEVMNFAKQELEAQAKKVQEKMGGSDCSSVFTIQVVVRSAIRKNAEQKIAFFESEVENLKGNLEDCEAALEMANNETDKANKVARDAKAKIAEAEERYAVAQSRIRHQESKFVQLKQTTTKYEKELESVHAEVEDLRRQLADKKATLEKKDAKIGDLSAKADQFKSRAILAEQKVLELDYRTRELESRAAGAEFKLADVTDAKEKIESSVYEYKEELKKTVSNSHSITEALSNEKRKTAALESEVADLKKKWRDANAGHANATKRITELEKVIVVIREQAEEEISSLASKKEASEKRLVTELETTKSKVVAGDRAASELKEKKAKLAELEHDLKIHVDRLADSGTKLKNLRLERDEAVKKADGAASKVKTLEARIGEYEVEIQTVKKRSASLEVQLRTVGVKIEEHKSLMRGREEMAMHKAEIAQQLLEEIKQSELEMENDEVEFVDSVNTSMETSMETSLETYVETSTVEFSQSSESKSSATSS